MFGKSVDNHGWTPEKLLYFEWLQMSQMAYK